MAPLRTPLQGVWNVVRFNWHFYLAAGGAALVLAGLWQAGPSALRPYAGLLLVLALVPMLVSLLITAYIYDFSGLYQFKWLQAAGPVPAALLTVSAGFDEISAPLAHQYPNANLLAADFYDAARHTEVSIQRARRAYPPYPGTHAVDTRAELPLPAGSIDLAVAFLAAHEIRDAAERAAFFRELTRVLAPTGTVVVTEHLRDLPNFLAYTIGFLHFHSRQAWLATFRAAGLRVAHEVKITPFITAFFLRKHGPAA
ncbi:methyltransferase domain-containing protein [Microvirga sp. STS02]|uniref:class I SAM-dependent methyltransferase n=1 Tax=Hymenobacter negativus TaxID=2795026 RepID=UPI0018DB70A7|nr:MULTISPECIES: class I SAM-dependent methyltransferase [Bacteria]MBH8569092.1 methyltransferase domain-containing protein [Hymenobacter negativus]MBR7208827.1 methyltransferase domain-containing protein [Microvirga sp. STS02]